MIFLYNGIMSVHDKAGTDISLVNKKITAHKLFHSFCIYPELKFETQGDDEQVVLVLRAHPITQIPWLLNAFMLSVALIVINLLLPPIFNGLQFMFLNFFWIAIIFAYAWFNILSWLFNVGIITSERVIDIDFSSVVYREVTETPLNRIQDITNKSGGFLESFIDFGDIFVQTAGTEPNIEFLNTPKPTVVVKIINGLIQHQRNKL